MFRVRQNRGCRSPQNLAKRAALSFHCSIAVRIASWLTRLRNRVAPRQGNRFFVLIVFIVSLKNLRAGAHTRFRSCPLFPRSGKIRSLDWLVAFHLLSRKNCAPADIELVTTKEAPETVGLAQSVQFVEPRSVELCNVQPV